MKHIKIILVFLVSVGYSYAQNVTVPKFNLHWDFDQTTYDNYNKKFIPKSDIMKGGGTIPLTYIEATTPHTSRNNFVNNRFGVRNSAYQMDADDIIDFSSYNEQKFFGLKPTVNATSTVESLTISLWVNFNEESSTERLIFGAKESATGDVKFGLALKDKVLYLKRFYENPDGSVGVPWSYTCFAPAAFDAGTGWYYVCVVFDRTQKYMRIVLGKPNGGATYGPGTNSNVPGTITVTREFDGRLIWTPGLRPQVKDFEYWFLGNAEGLAFDDLKIWDQSLKLEELTQAYENEKATASTSKAAPGKQKILDIEEPVQPPNFENTFLVHPNPSSGVFSLGISLKNGGTVGYSLYSLDGRQLLKEEGRNFSSGQHTIHINAAERLSSGVYILKVDSDAFPNNNFHKIVIK